MATLKRLFAQLRLQVNDAKSAVARVWERKFLGYRVWAAKRRVVRPGVSGGVRGEQRDEPATSDPDCDSLSPAGAEKQLPGRP